jgi:hypothetical protein
MRSPRIWLILAVPAVLATMMLAGPAASAPAAAAVPHAVYHARSAVLGVSPAVSRLSAPQAAAATEYYLEDGNGDFAYYDSAGLWRTGDPKATEVTYTCEDSECDTIYIHADGGCMEWQGGIGITNAGCNGTARESWFLLGTINYGPNLGTSCSTPGAFFALENVYQTDESGANADVLNAGTSGTNLEDISMSCPFTNDDIWILQSAG